MYWSPSFALWLLFSPKGRIGRAQWWAGIILLLIISAPSIMTVFDEELAREYVIEIALFDLATLYPGYALDAKRFHDRDRSGLWGMFAVVIALFLIGFELLAFIDDCEFRELEWACNGALLAVAVWYLIDLGCARGVTGPNRFGLDPISRGTAQS